jgi:Rrf2 family protein
MATLKRGGIVRTTLGAHGGYALADDPATVSIGRVIRLLDGALAPLPCVSLRYYAACSCPDESTCALRDIMLDVRDATLGILDNESLAEMAAREGRASIDPRGIHADALAGRRP